MDPDFFRHSYHRTYYWAGLITTVLDEPLACVREMEGLFVDDGVLDFATRFDRYSALHKFTAFWIDLSFYHDVSCRQLVHAPGSPMMLNPRDEDRVLTVESALLELGIDYGQRSCDELKEAGRYPLAGEAEDDDFYFDWFQDLRISQPYEDLIRRLADEVFFVLFLNRGLLAQLNGLLAMHVQSLGLNPGERRGDLVARANGDVEVNRVEVPSWVREAVRFRDRNRCVECGLDMSQNWSRPAPEHFDHIVPLVEGGLNDVTNIQLLHRECNLSKGAQLRPVNEMHRRWYPRQD